MFSTIERYASLTRNGRRRIDHIVSIKPRRLDCVDQIGTDKS